MIRESEKKRMRECRPHGYDNRSTFYHALAVTKNEDSQRLEKMFTSFNNTLETDLVNRIQNVSFELLHRSFN